MEERILHHFDAFDGFIGESPYHGPAEVFFCPGCKYGHWFGTGPGAWTFNGDRERPTAMPSVMQTVAKADGGMRCHLYVTNGMLQFLDDCEHELAGKTVAMEPF